IANRFKNGEILRSRQIREYNRPDINVHAHAAQLEEENFPQGGLNGIVHHIDGQAVQITLNIRFAGSTATSSPQRGIELTWSKSKSRLSRHGDAPRCRNLSRAVPSRAIRALRSTITSRPDQHGGSSDQPPGTAQPCRAVETFCGSRSAHLGVCSRRTSANEERRGQTTWRGSRQDVEGIKRGPGGLQERTWRALRLNGSFMSFMWRASRPNVSSMTGRGGLKERTFWTIENNKTNQVRI
ncbi:unnamed protein product, partial [Nesidiocoris tenuis]